MGHVSISVLRTISPFGLGRIGFHPPSIQHHAGKYRKACSQYLDFGYCLTVYTAQKDPGKCSIRLDGWNMTTKLVHTQDLDGFYYSNGMPLHIRFCRIRAHCLMAELYYEFEIPKGQIDTTDCSLELVVVRIKRRYFGLQTLAFSDLSHYGF